jgi:hypothetical protein
MSLLRISGHYYRAPQRKPAPGLESDATHPRKPRNLFLGRLFAHFLQQSFPLWLSPGGDTEGLSEKARQREKQNKS